MSQNFTAAPKSYIISFFPSWEVREDDSNYRSGIVSLADSITDHLAKAEALLMLLHSSRDLPEDIISEASLAILDLVNNAHVQYQKQWEMIRDRYFQRDDPS